MTIPPDGLPLSAVDRAELRALAHDFGNILSSLSVYAVFLLEDLPAGGTERDFAERIAAGVDMGRILAERLAVLAGEEDDPAGSK